MKLCSGGREILTLEFSEDEDPITMTVLRFSDFFKSLSMNEKIVRLGVIERKIEKDIKLFWDPRRLKDFTLESIETGEKSDPDKDHLYFWSGILRALIACLVRGVVPEKPEELFEVINSMTFEGN